jgi:hypothetical protein
LSRCGFRYDAEAEKQRKKGDSFHCEDGLRT